MYTVLTGPQQSHTYKHFTLKHATLNTNKRTFSMDNYRGQCELFSGKKYLLVLFFSKDFKGRNYAESKQY